MDLLLNYLFFLERKIHKKKPTSMYYTQTEDQQEIRTRSKQPPTHALLLLMFHKTQLMYKLR